MPVTMIQPKKINVGETTRAIDLGLRATDAEVEAGYKLTYWNWERENWPEWDVAGPKTTGGDRVLERRTSSTPFIFVDLGTSGPYTIRAKNAPTLKFQTGFVPKTSPGRLISQPGAKFGPWASPIEVEHPGIEPRGFSVQLAEDAEESLPTHIDTFLKRVR